MQIPGERRDRSREPMAALIDVVLLLLIFLLLAGTMAPPEPFAVEPPRAREVGAEIPESEAILLAADGRLAHDARVIPPAELPEVLSAIVANASPPVLEIKADGAVGAGSLLRLLRESERAGAERVRLLVVEQQR